MIPLDDEILMAYADGQLEATERAEVEAALAENPEAWETVQLFQDTRCTLSGLYDAPLREAVPARLLAALQEDNRVVAFPQRRQCWYRSTAIPWSLAATVAVCAVGLATGIFTSTDLFTPDMQPALTDNLLNQALENQPSGTPLVIAGNGVTREIMPLLTFQDTEGRYCREFENQLIHAFGKNSVTVGVACRDSDGWQVQAQMNRTLIAQETSDPGYQPASGEAQISPYDAILDRLMQSLPVTPAEEAAILERDWGRVKR